MPRTDFTFVNHGSVCMLTPVTRKGSVWTDEHLPEDRQTFGGGIAIEPRYAQSILDGIVEEVFGTVLRHVGTFSNGEAVFRRAA